MEEISIISMIFTALLALVCLFLVLSPLFKWNSFFTVKSASNMSPSEKAVLLTTLNEIEFEHNMGKLSEKDYFELKNQYESEVAAVMKSEVSLDAGVLEDPDLLEEVEREIEQAVLQYKKKQKGES